jgi:hypothetical protein
MKTLKKDLQIEEVLECYDRENQGSATNRESASFRWARGYLAQKSLEAGGKWTLVLLSKEEIPKIMLPDHRHPRENPQILIPNKGMTLSEAAARVPEITQRTGECWENIESHEDRDFSQVHIFLQHQNGGFMNLDGLHRLLAWAIFGKEESITAYVLDWPDAGGE